jgi:hypothetical protein
MLRVAANCTVNISPRIDQLNTCLTTPMNNQPCGNKALASTSSRARKFTPVIMSDSRIAPKANLTRDGFDAAMQQRLIDLLLVSVKGRSQKRVRRHPSRSKFLKRRIIGGGARLQAQAFNSVVDCAPQISSANVHEFLRHGFNIDAALVENVERYLLEPC